MKVGPLKAFFSLPAPERSVKSFLGGKPYGPQRVLSLLGRRPLQLFFPLAC